MVRITSKISDKGKIHVLHNQEQQIRFKLDANIHKKTNDTGISIIIDDSWNFNKSLLIVLKLKLCNSIRFHEMKSMCTIYTFFTHYNKLFNAHFKTWRLWMNKYLRFTACVWSKIESWINNIILNSYKFKQIPTTHKDMKENSFPKDTNLVAELPKLNLPFFPLFGTFEITIHDRFLFVWI